MSTIGKKLATHGGVGPGFDFLRVILAVSVVAWHVDAVLTGTGTLDANPIWSFFGYAILTMFFALSGFLISGSAERLNLGNFLLNRSLRILPALIVEVTLSAIILGVIFTSLPAISYFSSQNTWKYFTNVFGLINYQLPGVFKNNPSDFVNVSLWTVPYEYYCYVIMSAVIIFGILKRPFIIISALISVILFGLVLQVLLGSIDESIIFHKIADRLFIGHQSRLFVGFIGGIAIYVYRDRIPYSKIILLSCVLLCAIFPLFGTIETIGYPVANLLIGPALVYLTVYIGVSNLPKIPLLQYGDYSYGIYLYGFPIQQVIYSIFPGASAWLQFIMSIIPIAIFAAFSWHCIEKPILRLRKQFAFVSRMRTADAHRDRIS